VYLLSLLLKIKDGAAVNKVYSCNIPSDSGPYFSDPSFFYDTAT